MPGYHRCRIGEKGDGAILASHQQVFAAVKIIVHREGAGALSDGNRLIAGGKLLDLAEGDARERCQGDGVDVVVSWEKSMTR